MFTLEEWQFLNGVLNSKGINVPIDKCPLVAGLQAKVTAGLAAAAAPPLPIDPPPPDSAA